MKTYVQIDNFPNSLRTDEVITTSCPIVMSAFVIPCNLKSNTNLDFYILEKLENLAVSVEISSIHFLRHLLHLFHVS